MNGRRAPVFVPPAADLAAKTAELNAEIERLRDLVAVKPTQWTGLRQDSKRRRVIVDKAGLLPSIELPRAVQRDLDWHTEGRRGAVDAAFNPSIFRLNDGRIFMLYRAECVPWFRYSKIAIVELDSLLCPVSGTNTLLEVPTDWDNYNAEDPRFIAESGKSVFIAYNDGFRQSVAELHVDGWRVLRAGKITEVSGLTLSEKEKNWTFTLTKPGPASEFQCIYSIHPLVKLEVVLGESGAVAVHRSTHQWDCPWNHGTVRGGSNLFLWDNQLQGVVFHSSIKIADCKHGPVRQYYAGVALLNHDRVVAISKEPLLVGEPCAVENRPSQHQVVFPSGVVWKDGVLVVSYGLDDLDCALSCWTRSDISGSLEWLP